MLAARGNRREVLGKILVVGAQVAAGGEAPGRGLRPREDGLRHLPQDDREEPFVLGGARHLRLPRRRRYAATQCYVAMGTLHALYKPVPGKFKDYIAIPKVNGYQSLHTTLIGPYGTPVEFQIRTQEMHHVAESGVAAHWLYKDDDSDLSELQSRTHQWLQSLLEIQRQTGDSSEFLEHIKVDLFPDKVYVFTPKGKIVSLPRGATPVDFAYGIHTDVGNKMRRRAHQRRDSAAAHAAAQRRHGRDRHRARRRDPIRRGCRSCAPARHARKSATSCAR